MEGCYALYKHALHLILSWVHNGKGFSLHPLSVVVVFVLMRDQHNICLQQRQREPGRFPIGVNDHL